MAFPSVSILVPTLEAGRYLDRLLPALEGQSYDGTIELRALDSSSTDDTVSRLEAAGWGSIQPLTDESFRAIGETIAGWAV